MATEDDKAGKSPGTAATEALIEAADESKMTDGQIIARRTTDIDSSTAREYLKVFVLPPGPKPIPENGYDHAANMVATREFALQNGMRPVGDTKLKSVEPNADGISWDLTYTLPVAVDERLERASEEFIVTQGRDEIPVNTDKAGHSGDTRKKAAAIK